MTLSPPQPPSSSRRHAAIQELRRGTQLAELLRQQLELIPEPNRRHAAVANVGEISMAMESSLSILQSEMEQEHPSSEVRAVAMTAPTAYSSDGGTTSRERNGSVARTRRVRHRRGRPGAELPIKEILTEAPENDRFHWRKYGEKNILNAEYPRLYYKCGYSDDGHKCPAKKYVQQQSNSDPPLFIVTLVNEHTCDPLFRDVPSSSSSAPQVLDFTKASLSPPLMAAASSGLKKKEEEDSMSLPMHSYSYGEYYLSSSLPTMSPDGDQVRSIYPRDLGGSSSQRL